VAEGMDFRQRLLLAALLKTRLTKTQARRLLGRSYRYYKRVIGSLLDAGLIEERRHSVATIIQLTEKGREVALRASGGIDPAPYLREIGALTEPWYTAPEAAKTLGIPTERLLRVAETLGVGYRLVGKGAFAESKGTAAKYRIWAFTDSDIRRLSLMLKLGMQRRGGGK